MSDRVNNPLHSWGGGSRAAAKGGGFWRGRSVQPEAPSTMLGMVPIPKRVRS